MGTFYYVVNDANLEAFEIGKGFHSFFERERDSQPFASQQSIAKALYACMTSPDWLAIEYGAYSEDIARNLVKWAKGGLSHLRLVDEDRLEHEIEGGKEIKITGSIFEETVRPDDSINRPAHYTSGAVEVIDAIEAWELGYRLGNVVKYVARAGKKHPDTRTEDLKKALWYLTREIEKG